MFSAKQRRRRNPKHNNNPNRENILSFPSKPLTNQQKQDLFLRYNPEFQRLPRYMSFNSTSYTKLHIIHVDSFKKTTTTTKC